MEPADTPGHSSQITYAEAVAQAAEALIALPAMPHNVLQQVLEQQALLLQQQQILQMQLRIKRRAEALYAAHATTTAQNSLPGRWPGAAHDVSHAGCHGRRTRLCTAILW